MTATRDAAVSGDMLFFDNYIPRLEDGDYTITVTQKLVGTGDPGFGGEKHDADRTFTKIQKFTVTGPRFQLDPTDIHREFPPPGSQGVYDQFMPHVALRKRALPWERDVFQDKGVTPWVALLVFDTSEILDPAVGPAAATGPVKPNPTKATSVTLQSLKTPDPGVVAPDVDFDPYEKAATTLCRVIDVAPETFRSIVPAQEDLRYLAHGRKVSIHHKSTTVTVEAAGSQTEDDGTQWFSVVIAGRLPKAPAAGEKPAVSIAHLVSLEGLDKYVRKVATDERPVFPDGTSRVRLVSLASWTFTCLPEAGESFALLMQGLVPKKESDRDELLLRFPVPKLGPSPSENEQFAHAALEAGYVAREYATRQGENTFAWYRGPFGPALPARFPAGRAPFAVAGQAAIYDAKYGLFDLSYAAAFEIGRLAAVHTGTFASSLIAWRRSARQLLDLLRHRMASGALDALLSTTSGQLQAEQVLEHAMVSRTFIEYMATAFADEIEGTVHAAHSGTPAGVGDLTGGPPAPNAAAALAAALADPAIVQFLKDMDYEDLLPITEWLARLYLLKGVPFEYLVPDARLLPPESVRFFYVDQNWLDSLLDGALSIGIQTSIDSTFQTLMFDVIRDAVRELVHTVRDRLLGIATTTTPAPGDAGDGSMAGMLVRSAVVSGWPGLEVKAAGTASDEGDADPIKLLRMDHVGSDVLLCLFPRLPAWVAIDEPHEGLHFGLESERKVYLRHLTVPDAGRLFEPQDTVSAVIDPQRMLDIRALLIALKGKLGKDLGPAEFAVQMVDVPERFIYQSQAKP